MSLSSFVLAFFRLWSVLEEPLEVSILKPRTFVATAAIGADAVDVAAATGVSDGCVRVVNAAPPPLLALLVVSA